MRKTNGIFVVKWSFEKLDFFPITYQKSGFMTLILSKFQISNYKC